jgi:4-hydroxy-3-polyprenylbenzoate decarboxylase
VRFELASMLALLDDGPVVVVDQVDGCQFPVVSNLLNSRSRFARALGCEVSAIAATITQATTSGRTPRPVIEAACQEVVVTAGEHHDLLSLLPIPQFFEFDSGPYITAGLVLAHEPSSGHRNASYARVKPLGGNRAFIGIAPNHHLTALARAAASQGRALDVAIAMGTHPAIQTAGCLYLQLGQDELFNAGALLGEPVRVAQGVTVDVLVPADAEIVIEARLHFTQTVAEGWVSEYHGMYEDYGEGHVLEITALTHRHDASYQVIMPGLFAEHALLGGLAVGAGLVTALRRATIPVADLAVTKAGGGRVNVVAAVGELKPGQAKRAFFACWAAVSMIKQITLVDLDIDVWDYEQVEWARTARMRWGEDTFMVPDMITDRNEPMQAGSMVTKIGLDATKKPGRRRTNWDRALPPAEAVQAAHDRLIGEGFRQWLAPGVGVARLLGR